MNRTCQNQAIRAKAIGNYLRTSCADIFCLQEVWGSHTAEIHAGAKEATALTNHSSSLGSVKNNEHLLNKKSVVDFTYPAYTYFDWIHNYVMANGGLTTAWRAHWTLKFHKKYTFSQSITRSRKGIQVCCFENHQAERRTETDVPPTILLFNLHLDYANIDNSQIKQLREVQAFIETTVNDVIQGKMSEVGSIEAENLVVLVAGDFNIDADKHCQIVQNQKDKPTFDLSNPNVEELFDDKIKSLYRTCMEEQPQLAVSLLSSLFDARDLLAETGSAPNASYEYGKNSLCMFDSRRLDLILAIDKVGDKTLRKVSCERAEIVKQQPGYEFSDHWPVKVHLSF